MTFCSYFQEQANYFYPSSFYVLNICVRSRNLGCVPLSQRCAYLRLVLRVFICI